MDHLWLYISAVFILVVFLFLLISKKRGFFNNLFKRTLDKNLEEDSEKLLNELKELNPSKETINNFAVSFANQIFKYRFYGLIFAIIPTTFIFYQTILISNQNTLIQRQNEKIDEQNEKIRMQVYLQEASRRNNLVLLMDNVLEKVSDEIEKGNNTLSKPLIGRISALSQGFQPYYFLEDSMLTEKPFSPERGQLLLALANSGIDTHSMDIIYEKATFRQAYLKGAQMDSLYLKNVNLAESDLREAFLRNSDLEDAKLWSADIRATYLDRYANLSGANLQGADLRGTSFTSSDLIGTRLWGANLRGADFNNANLSGANLRETELIDANFMGACLSGAMVIDKNWIDNLEVWNVKGNKRIDDKYDLIGDPQITFMNGEPLYYILTKKDPNECSIMPGYGTTYSPTFRP